MCQRNQLRIDLNQFLRVNLSLFTEKLTEDQISLSPFSQATKSMSVEKISYSRLMSTRPKKLIKLIGNALLLLLWMKLTLTLLVQLAGTSQKWQSKSSQVVEMALSSSGKQAPWDHTLNQLKLMLSTQVVLPQSATPANVIQSTLQAVTVLLWRTLQEAVKTPLSQFKLTLVSVKPLEICQRQNGSQETRSASTRTSFQRNSTSSRNKLNKSSDQL